MYVGIEAMSFAVPRRYLELTDLARARGVEPEKYTAGLGCRRMAIADPGEDTVALAATATKRLMERTGLDPRRIGMLVAGTETGVDHSKAVASYVQGALGLPRSMRVFDTQHACYGGTAALMATAGWLASMARVEQVGVVVMADIARYQPRTAGEPTQGAGAVALLVSRNPRLLKLDLEVSGVFSTDVHDFWRPLGRREALVDGHYSIDCYLEAIAGSWREWRDAALARGLLRRQPGTYPCEMLPRILFHVPFGKMARKAHARVRLADIEDAGRRLDAGALAAETAAASGWFARQVAPALDLCAEIGNSYTASLYLSLLGLLHKQAGELAGQRIGLFSYGSGCVSEFFSGVVGPDAAEAVAAMDVDEVLAQRERIDVAEYERLYGLSPDTPPAEVPVRGGFRFTGLDQFKRRYAAG